MDNKISICIPAYKRVGYLKRLLESIIIQTYKNYEVIITDDSDDDSVLNLVKNYAGSLPLRYHKNHVALGTPANWLESMGKAEGHWIKLVHDDDWFSSPDSLQQHANAIAPSKSIICCGYNAYYEEVGTYKNETITTAKFEDIAKDPSLLFAQNVIGPPTVVMLSKKITEQYDVNLKWFVDIEFYFRTLDNKNAIYITQPLMNVSYNDSQVTTYTKTNPAVVIPESIYILNKHGKKIVSGILAYDSWWRVFRNMGVRSISDVQKYAGDALIPPIVKRIVCNQRLIPGKALKIGAISKCGMALSYVLNKMSGAI